MNLIQILLCEDRVDLIAARHGDKIWGAYQEDPGMNRPELKDGNSVVKFLSKHISEKHLQQVANWYQAGGFYLEDARRTKDH